jgi:hypothetical protein
VLRRRMIHLRFEKMIERIVIEKIERMERMKTVVMIGTTPTALMMMTDDGCDRGREGESKSCSNAALGILCQSLGETD